MPDSPCPSAVILQTGKSIAVSPQKAHHIYTKKAAELESSLFCSSFIGVILYFI